MQSVLVQGCCGCGRVEHLVGRIRRYLRPGPPKQASFRKVRHFRCGSHNTHNIRGSSILFKQSNLCNTRRPRLATRLSGPYGIAQTRAGGWDGRTVMNRIGHNVRDHYLREWRGFAATRIARPKDDMSLIDHDKLALNDKYGAISFEYVEYTQ